MKRTWIGLLAVLLLAACGPQEPPAPPATPFIPTPLPRPTPLPPLPTIPPPGSEQDPLVFLFVTTQDGTGFEEALAAQTDLVIEVRTTGDYAEALDALCSGEAQVVSLGAFGAIAALDQGCGSLVSVAQMGGTVETRGQLVTAQARGIIGISAFRAQTFCRDDLLSVTGWVVPSLRLRAAGISPFNGLDDVVDTGSDAATLEALLDGTCDAGATAFGAEGAADNPDSFLVVEELPPVPNDVIMIANGFAQEPLLRDLLASSQGGLAALLGADGLSLVDEAAFAELRTLMQSAGVDPAALND